MDYEINSESKLKMLLLFGDQTQINEYLHNTKFDMSFIFNFIEVFHPIIQMFLKFLGFLTSLHSLNKEQ